MKDQGVKREVKKPLIESEVGRQVAAVGVAVAVVVVVGVVGSSILAVSGIGPLALLCMCK